MGDDNPETQNEDLRRDLDMLTEKVDAHIDDSKERWDRITNTTEMNALAIKDAVAAVDRQTKSTEGLVEAWVAANGFYRVVKWLSGIGVPVGAIIIYLLADKFPALTDIFKQQ